MPRGTPRIFRFRCPSCDHLNAPNALHRQSFHDARGLPHIAPCRPDLPRRTVAAPPRPISRKYALSSSLMAEGCGIGVSLLITENCERAESRLSAPRRKLSTGPSGSCYKCGGGRGDG